MEKPSRRKALGTLLAALGAALAAMIFWDRLFVALIVVGALPTDVEARIAQDTVYVGFVTSYFVTVSTVSVGAFLAKLFYSSFLGPLLEELAFRWPVCTIAYRKDGSRRFDDGSLAVTVLIAGLVFAALHGWRYGFSYLLIVRLAPLGLVLAAVWLWAWRRYQSAFKAIVCCALVHGAYNFTVETHEFSNAANVEAARQEGRNEGIEKMKERCIEVLQKLPPECIESLQKILKEEAAQKE